MVPQASSAVRTSQETRPEQRLASPHLALAEPPAAAQRNLRPLEVAGCAMCGIALPLALLVPDGGRACADIRWYCKDARSCTERWTTAGPSRHAGTSADPGHAVAGAGEAFPGAAPAGPRGGMLGLAKPA
jgi:hypothetical protein